MSSTSESGTVLLVEDGALHAFAGASALQKNGYTLIRAGDGETAVRTALTTPEIELILMDLEPGGGMDGSDVAERILQERDLPVVFLLSPQCAPEVLRKTGKVPSYGYIDRDSGDAVLLFSIQTAFRLFSVEQESKRRTDELRESADRLVQKITENSATHDALQATMYELRKSQEVARVGNWVWHIPQNRVEWSDEMYRIFGIEKDKFTGDLAQVLSESIHPEDRAEVDRSNASVVESNRPIPVEYRVIRPDGSVRSVWAEAGELELDGEGRPLLLRGIVHDITERKKAQEALRASEIRLSRSEKLTQSGGWEWEMDEDLFTVTQGWKDIHGWERDTLSLQELFSLAHSDDLPMIENEFHKALTDGTPYALEHRIVRHDTGEVRTVRAFGEVVRDSGGRPLRMFGAAQDITRQKSMEEALQIRQKALSASMDAVAIADLKGNLTYVNPAFLNLWDYASGKEILGRPAVEFWEFGDEAQKVVQALQTHGSWQGELSARRRDGSLFDVQLSSSMVMDDREEPLCLMGVFRDISEQKLKESRINKLLKEKELLLRETHHRIKNNYTTVEALLNLQSDQAVHPEVVSALQNAKSRIRSMSALYDTLLRTDQFEHVSIKPYLEDLAAGILAAHSTPGLISLKTSLEDQELEAAQVVPVGAIVTELMINSLKHAYEPGENGTIFLSLACEGGTVTLCVGDEGRGIPLGFDFQSTDSFGLTLVRMMAEQIGGTLEVQSRVGEGSLFSVSFTL